MPMRLATVPVLACLVAALAVGCGSAGPKATTTTAASSHWAAGLRDWGRSMRGALDGMSELFASPDAVSALETADPRADAKLAAYERTLASCSVRLTRVGAAPAAYAQSARLARQACTSLEQGAELVKKALKQFQAGLGSDLFSRSTQPLSVGQSDIELALQELELPSG